MLTATECRNLFVVGYKIECQKNKMKELDFPDKIIASWMSSGQQDIADRLKILITYVDVAYTPVTSFTKYDLPSNFGSLLRTEPELKIVDVNEMNSYVQSGNNLQIGVPQQVAVYHESTGYHLVLGPLPNSTNTIRVWYSINPGMYSPSAAAAQDWATFDGSTFTGSLKIPDKYIDLLILYMLGKIFDQKKMEYEAHLNRMRINSGSTRKQGLEYQPIGGYSIE
jgi:hypothetical protein